MFGDGSTQGEASRTHAGAEQLDLYLEAVPCSVPAARRAATGWAAAVGARGPDLDRIGLAISEAVTNAVVHAYSTEPPSEAAAGQVHLTGGSRPGELTILVADRGCGIGRALSSPGLGLGLAVIDESCDALTIRSRPGRGIRLEMGFRLSRPPGPRVTRGPER
jgi:serine/threonine-protein kinase RsbW/stage II sporulation protein AB (anti-sigma F factor)